VLSKGERVVIVLGVAGLIIASIQAWDILDKRGIIGAALAVIVWLLALGMIAYAVYRNLKDANRAGQLRSEIVTIRDENRIHMEALERQLEDERGKAKKYFHDYNHEVQSHQETKAKEREANTFKDQALREVESLRSEPTGEIREDPKAGLLRNAPRLWVDYKPATKNPSKMEVLIFSKDGGTAVMNIQVGPLAWKVTETRPIALHSVIGVLRSDPIECKFSAYEEMKNIQRLFELPELMREMMRKFGVTAQPLVEVSYEDMEGNCFHQNFVLSIDPYDKIVWEPYGSLRVR
jgi:hypothetical protein